jgi:hypothetical protein
MTSIYISLRIESPDGRLTGEYRIRNGHVERRELCDGDRARRDWTQLDAEQLKHAVYRDRAFAHWLQRRLGWRNALRACVPWKVQQAFSAPERRSEQRAA